MDEPRFQHLFDMKVDLDARGTLRTDDGALFYAAYRGIFSASQEA